MTGLEQRITRAIVRATMEDWVRLSSVDVVVVGAGPSGMTAAKYLAERGLRVLILERRLCFGGGIGGGGMLFHRVVVDERALEVLRDFNVRFEEAGKGLYTVDAAELIAKLATGALDAGAKMLLGVSVEDVIYRESPLRITGVVVQWSAVQAAGMHVDPLFIEARAVVDATGHEAEVIRIVERKVKGSGVRVAGESSAYAEEAERLVVEGTGRVIPGLYVTGMAVAALHGLPRMGPIFSGMLLSGRRVAEIVARDLLGG